MLISLNWLKQYLTINLSTDELIRLIGSRLVEVEGVIDQTHKYDDVYVVEVVSAEKIPDTHLTLCRINDGGVKQDTPRDADGLIQVMCGAPNVRVGMLTIWIAPGATVPASFNSDAPFIIGTRKMLKKYESHGMLAGADELDFGDDHSGIVELEPKSATPGTTLADHFRLADTILEIENKSLTHRPDTFGIIGFAREVAGILGQKFVTPDWILSDNTQDFNLHELPLEVKIDDSTLCPRYTALILSCKHPLERRYLQEIQTLLSRSGMRPISPLVDLTNYLMLLTGQPLHAFDYDKLLEIGDSSSPKIIVRAARQDETIKLLDGKDIALQPHDIVITSNDVPVALAGAMGGASTAVDENTKTIILESATFSLYNLRKTQMAHGIFSEAITRFTKGQPASQTLAVAGEFARLVSGQMRPRCLVDCYPNPTKPIKVNLDAVQVNALLGSNYRPSEIIQCLENVGFAISGDYTDDSITFIVPAWRTDIHIPEDIIEEVGRLNGYDNIDPVLPLHATANPNPLYQLKIHLRQALSSFGANELLTYSFVSQALLDKATQNPDNSYRIINSISPELQYIRQSIVPSLLDKSYINLKVPYDHFAIFELNQVTQKSFGVDQDSVPKEQSHLAFIVADRKEKDGAYYEAQRYLEAVLRSLGISNSFKLLADVAQDDAVYRPFEPYRSAIILAEDGEELGVLGEFKNSVRANFKLPPYVAGFELDIAKLQAYAKTQHFSSLSLSEQLANEDLTLSVSPDTDYAEVYITIRQFLEAQGLIFNIKPICIYQENAGLNKNLTFHISFAHPTKTLTNSQIQGIMKKLSEIKISVG